MGLSGKKKKSLSIVIELVSPSYQHKGEEQKIGNDSYKGKGAMKGKKEPNHIPERLV